VSREPAWDVPLDSEFNLLVELQNLRSEIAERVDRVQVILELLAGVRQNISLRGARAQAEDPA
jgi:hypothetical protein